MNSIIDNITKEDSIAEIHLLLDSDIEHEKIVMVVEGLDDTKFINSVCFYKEKIITVQSYSGKIGVTEIMENYNDEKRVIAIRDRDYSNCKEEKGMFYYDYCCLEMMLISSRENFENIYNEYIYPSEMDSETTKEYILEQLKYISLLRKMNEEEELGLELYKIKINNVYDDTINIEKYKHFLNLRNDNFLKRNVELEKRLDTEYSKELDMKELLNITNGHDFCELLAIIAREHKRKGISKENMQSVLRCSYRKEDFSKTELYKKLREYETLNNIIIMKD